jgi:hypothetical protein
MQQSSNIDESKESGKRAICKELLVTQTYGKAVTRVCAQVVLLLLVVIMLP